MARVLLVAGGGIAAYKAPQVVRALKKAGHDVRVVLTEAAGAFVAELSLAAVSGHPVRTRLLDPGDEVGAGAIGHIELADWAEIVLVAPATADLLARVAAGLANDLATCVLLATRAPVVFAPAMNVNMWQAAVTQENLARLAGRGASFCGPDRGELACGWVGEGRMVDPEVLVTAVADRLASTRSWAGRRVLVSAGPTRTYLDPVRFVSNASTGRMGFALAEAAARRGAEVTLVAGPVTLPTPPGVRQVDVETTAELARAMASCLEGGAMDLVAMTAAVSDLEVDGDAPPDKLPKDALVQAVARTRWRRAPDVLTDLCARFGASTFFLGFAAQTEEDETQRLSRARAKRARKGCQALFVNRVGAPGVGFASPTNTGHLITEDGVEDFGPARPKVELAGWLLDRIAPRLPAPGFEHEGGSEQG